ncbi:hypothetical protein HWC07_gp123 [Pantoea phage vB_PagM_LIET2]|uniref:Uncharacterized protein n=1 Tax=Pantoea phage vB_PagM_LIET2 TaxID=2508071 RepID=A0A411AWD6_9CAUD|nr:hypothetical protein HWC07_gp123 [Pantoea phage vB_PagM_LIET2]QAX92375.1 hypothetical protein LIET2_gp123 [Pantoea phage vB_PagM_LIET2]
MPLTASICLKSMTDIDFRWWFNYYVTSKTT